MPEKPKKSSTQKKMLFISGGQETPLAGVVSYFLRLTTRRALGEETFQVNRGFCVFMRRKYCLV